MKREAQEIETIPVENLLARVGQQKTAGDRLVAISCAAIEGMYEITYSFEDRDHRFVHLRAVVEPGATVPSVTPVYWGAFVYENEIHDLYGITVSGINIDFGGHFYTTKVPFPFAASPKAGDAGRTRGEE
ncbi:MAG TPA: NADH-quinone oxidoreductase subunit C [Methanoregulaceae archaeon]|nr:NADH-quinone oxidoreductase subunit C [Methanoregulaceae archaeon]HQJ88697.1 NADH-quinone oxidoreductase subunit C [Methanoregulaceae archaeon]